MSAKFTLVASTRTRTRPGPGSGRGMSSRRREVLGWPSSCTRHARIAVSLLSVGVGVRAGEASPHAEQRHHVGVAGTGGDAAVHEQVGPVDEAGLLGGE